MSGVLGVHGLQICLRNLQDDNDVLALLRDCEGLKLDKVPPFITNLVQINHSQS